MTNTMKITALSIVLLLCVWDIVAQAKVDLRFSPEVGAIYRQKSRAEQNIEQSGQQMQQIIAFEYLYNVIEKNDKDNYRIKTTYTTVLYEQDNPAMGKIAYDSENPPENIHPMAKGYAALVGKSFYFEISPKGEVVEVSGTDEMIDDIVEDLGVEDEAKKEQLRSALKKQYGTEVMQQNMKQAFARYPNAPVAVGESWLQNTAQAMPPMLTETRFTLKSKEQNTYIIDFNSTLKADPNGEALEMQGMKIEYNLSGIQSGSSQIDAKTGWATKTSIEQDISGTMKVQGMEIPMSIKSTNLLETIVEE